MDARDYIAERDELKEPEIQTNTWAIILHELEVWERTNNYNHGIEEDINGIKNFLESLRIALDTGIPHATT